MIRWENWKLETGIEAIDDDHKVLFETLNLIMEAARTHRNDEVGEAIDLLKTYASVHFAREEAAMAETGCPMAERNAMEHREFEAQLAALSNHFAERGADEQLMDTVQRILVDWLVNHILQVDHALAGTVPADVDES